MKEVNKNLTGKKKGVLKTIAVRAKRGEAKLGVNRKEALWKKLVHAAEGGSEEDPVTQKEHEFALKLVTERLWPKIKPITQTVNITLPKGTTLEEKLNLILEAVMTGACDPEVGLNLITAINSSYAIKINNELLEKFEKLQDDLQQWKTEKTLSQTTELKRFET